MSKQGADKEDRAWKDGGISKITLNAHLSCRAIRKTLIQSPKGGFNQSIKKQSK
jgi:hypothetical protein